LKILCLIEQIELAPSFKTISYGVIIAKSIHQNTGFNRSFSTSFVLLMDKPKITPQAKQSTIAKKNAIAVVKVHFLSQQAQVL